MLQESLVDGIPRELVHETMGNALRIRGDIKNSILFLQKEHDLFPNPILLGKIGALQAKEQIWNEAAESFAGYFSHFPNKNTHRHSYAQVLFNLKKYKRSEQVLKPLMDREEVTPRVLLLQANIMAKTNRMDEGKKLFEEAQSIRERTKKE
jgi:predicted Zn-dependent protease